MATATLYRNAPRPSHDGKEAPATASSPAVERIPPFWSSLFNATPAQQTSANDAHPQTEKPSAVVGGLWIQIR